MRTPPVWEIGDQHLRFDGQGTIRGPQGKELTDDASVVAKEEASSADEEAEEVGSKSAEACASKLRHCRGPERLEGGVKVDIRASRVANLEGRSRKSQEKTASLGRKVCGRNISTAAGAHGKGLHSVCIATLPTHAMAREVARHNILELALAGIK